MMPRFIRGATLERRLFGRAAATALELGGAAPDVVLAHSASLPGALLGQSRRQIGGAAFVVSLYDHELYDLAPASAIVRRGIVRTLKRADCAVYLSEALRRHAIDLAGPHRNVVIPLGIATHVAPSTVRPPGFTVCTVTRLIARKRVDRLIFAFARLAAERPDARLVIVGDGPEQPALKQLVRALGIESLVELTGALDARGAQERMARASVMALPSVRAALAARVSRSTSSTA